MYKIETYVWKGTLMKNILKYLLKRIFIGFFTIYLIITFTFFLLHNLPGNPFEEDGVVPDQVKENIMIKYELDKPLNIQYVKYVKNILKFDFGISMKKNGKTVNSIIKDSFKVSFELGTISVLISILFGIPLGIISAIKKDSNFDKIMLILSILLISIPSFILASLLQLYAVNIHKGILIDKFNLNLSKIPLVGFDKPSHKILPVMALSFFIIAKIIRITRVKVIEVLRQDYIKLAITKGLTPFYIIVKHTLKNAIIPIISVLSPIIVNVLTGSFIIENLFSIPGLGRYYVNSIIERDYTVVLGLTIFYSIFFIIIMLIVDILYVILNPNIRLGGVSNEV